MRLLPNAPKVFTQWSEPPQHGAGQERGFPLFCGVEEKCERWAWTLSMTSGLFTGNQF